MVDCEHTTYRHGKLILTQCECFCPKCFKPGKSHSPGSWGCICAVCDHDVKIPLHPSYFETKTVVEHKCTECSIEIVRTGTRGRWPTKCSACKESAT